MTNTSVFIDLKIKIQYYKPTKEIIYFLYDTDNNFVAGGYKLVLRSNKGGRHYELPYNYGHDSARECLSNMNRLTRTELNRAIKRVKE